MFKIYNEDCLEGMKKIADGSIDLVLTDLPYGTTDCVFDKQLLIEPLWEQFLRVTKINAAIVLFSQMPFGAELIQSQKDIFRYEWVWSKSLGVGFLNAKRMPLRCHENILVFYRALPTYNPQFTKGKPYKRQGNNNFTSNYRYHVHQARESDGWRFPQDVLKAAQPLVAHSNSYHPQEKPVGLLKYLIKTYTNEGETVLDATMGSGSTGVAAISTGRNFIGFELEKNFYDIAQKRLEAEKEYREKIFLRLQNATMKIVEVATAELKPYENNPRNNDNAVDAVAESIKNFGFKVPIVIDAENVIVAGHTRYKAALKLGLEKIPCIIADDLTPEQVRAFRVVDNKTSEFATWAVKDLNAELATLTDFKLENFGIDVRKIKNVEETSIEEPRKGNNNAVETVKMQFKLHKKQAKIIRQAIREIGKTAVTSGQGSLIYEIIRQWAELKK